jgi:hypothetical protein
MHFVLVRGVKFAPATFTRLQASDGIDPWACPSVTGKD